MPAGRVGRGRTAISDEETPDASVVSIDEDEEAEEEASSMRAEVMQHPHPQHGEEADTSGGMCAAGRWLLGTLFAALGGFVGKDLVLLPNAAGAGAVWGAPYSLGCLALDAVLVRRSDPALLLLKFNPIHPNPTRPNDPIQPYNPLKSINQGVVAGMAVLAAHAMGEGRPYRPANAPSSSSYSSSYSRPTRSTQQPPPPLPLPLRHHALVLGAAAVASVLGGFGIAWLRSGLGGRWGWAKGLWVWQALRHGHKPAAEAGDVSSSSSSAAAAGAGAGYVAPSWLLLQGALASAAAVGVQVGTEGQMDAAVWVGNRGRGGKEEEEGKASSSHR